jgi:micrococcal nuclease
MRPIAARHANLRTVRTCLALALLALLAGCAGSEAAGPAESGVRIGHVVDGDSLVLADGRRVRLVQVDAPEGQHECYGEEAATALRRLLPQGTRVRLEIDLALDRIDRYGRLLRYVHREGLIVNLELVREGAAAPWFFDGDRGLYADRLLTVAQSARAGGRGLWGACPPARLDPLRGIDTGGP